MNLTISAAVIICLMSMMTTTGFPPTTTTDANEVETTPSSTEEEAAATATEAVNDPVHAEPVKDVIAHQVVGRPHDDDDEQELMPPSSSANPDEEIDYYFGNLASGESYEGGNWSIEDDANNNDSTIPAIQFSFISCVTMGCPSNLLCDVSTKACRQQLSDV